MASIPGADRAACRKRGIRTGEERVGDATRLGSQGFGKTGMAAPGKQAGSDRAGNDMARSD